MGKKQGYLASLGSISRYICEIIEIVIIAFAISWVIRNYVIELYVVPNNSMFPTYQVNESIIVEKYFYKKFNLVSHGDVIVFEDSDNDNSSETNIGRVLALPGDTIEIRNGNTYLNKQLLFEPYIQDRPKINLESIVVPEGSVLVLGDNREETLGITQLGTIPVDYILGKVLFSY